MWGNSKPGIIVSIYITFTLGLLPQLNQLIEWFKFGIKLISG